MTWLAVALSVAAGLFVGYEMAYERAYKAARTYYDSKLAERHDPPRPRDPYP